MMHPPDLRRLGSATRPVMLAAGLGLCLALSACPGGSSEPRLPRVGDAAPAFDLEALDGSQRVSIASLRGRPVLLNFWATWCPPCVEELPSLQALSERYAERGVAVYAISVDSDPPERIREFLSKRGIDIDVLLDPGGAVARSYGTFRFPETYLLDREGRITHKFVGAHEWTDDIYAAAIDELLAPSASGGAS